jgi:phage shock protein A
MMPFNVEDFQDLIRLLQERPEWRADLRRLVLTEELLGLPELVRELVQAQQRTEVRVGRLEEALIALTEAQQRIEVRVGRLEEALIALTEAQLRTEVRVGRLEEAQQRTEVRVGQLAESVESLRAETERRFQELAAAQLTLSRHMDDMRAAMQAMEESTAALTTTVGRLQDDVGKLQDDVGELKGSDLERRYRERPFTYFQRLIRQAHTLTGEELNAMLDAAVTAGQLTEEDIDEIVWADAIVRGRRRDDNQEVFLVVEASWGIGAYDVQRADRRASLLAKAGVTTLPVVAGMWVTPDGEVAARAMKVWRVTDGRVVPPEQV